ncbi:Rieske 2Fe-2S domain-containing protein [Chamaesiphon sp.]|uniref:Rieske 2Fe-2S domain-containing protein n=1 Tax=Chamaesiphon sp. TaxID=2814140 RepID=UPI003593EA35
MPLIYQAGCQDMRMTDRYVCPHQQLSLRGVPVNSDGEIVCPAHGLKWCTKTGSLIPRAKRTFAYYAIAYQPLMYEREMLVREALGVAQPDWVEVVWERLPESQRVYCDRSTFEADLAAWGNTPIFAV